MRYNFHAELANIKKNPQYILPGDINEPVKRFLEKIGCAVGVDVVKNFQEHVSYGSIELVHADVPNAKITMHIEAGMIGEYKECKSNASGKWTAYITKSVKNSKIDKRNPNKGKTENEHAK